MIWDSECNVYIKKYIIHQRWHKFQIHCWQSHCKLFFHIKILLAAPSRVLLFRSERGVNHMEFYTCTIHILNTTPNPENYFPGLDFFTFENSISYSWNFILSILNTKHVVALDEYMRIRKGHNQLFSYSDVNHKGWGHLAMNVEHFHRWSSEIVWSKYSVRSPLSNCSIEYINCCPIYNTLCSKLAGIHKNIEFIQMMLEMHLVVFSHIFWMSVHFDVTWI